MGAAREESPAVPGAARGLARFGKADNSCALSTGHSTCSRNHCETALQVPIVLEVSVVSLTRRAKVFSGGGGEAIQLGCKIRPASPNKSDGERKGCERAGHGWSCRRLSLGARTCDSTGVRKRRGGSRNSNHWTRGLPVGLNPSNSDSRTCGASARTKGHET